MGINILCAVGIFFGIHRVISQGDSLESALNAVDNRQRYSFGNYPIVYARENPVDSSYLPDSVSVGANDLEDYFSDGDDDLSRQISSSFRERLEEGREKQLQELSQLSNLASDDFDNSDYIPRDPWHKFRNNPYYRNERIPSRNRKRQFYPKFGYDSIGLRKREKYTPTDYYNEYKYLLNVNDDYPNDYIDGLDYAKRSGIYLEREDRYDKMYPDYYSNYKHVPVTKRSSDYSIKSKDKKRQIQSKTDPNVERDLSSVFSGSDVKKIQKLTKKADEGKKMKENHTNMNSSKPKNVTKKHDTKKGTLEVIPNSVSEKPLQIAKKSIDWSDYFGLDRRKKNKDDFDKEWLMERYHKAIAGSKKNTGYSHQPDHDISKKINKKKNDSDDIRLENMDRELKSIEDEIVDDALKYTGANEGVTDPKDIQEVKDGIITRLTKAYSVDKMRKALDEYKRLVYKEREKLKLEDNMEDETTHSSEQKRVSVPRKQAIDPKKTDQVEDNHIKCAQGNSDCNEENYKTPIEIIEELNYEVGGCPKIQRDCNQVAPLLGTYAKIFGEACNLYQMCLLCGNNSWYPATRQCDILYLSKVFDMCEGKTDCQIELHKSVRYLMNINRNLRDNPSEECNLVCPEGPDGL